jgi:hypothetical protein
MLQWNRSKLGSPESIRAKLPACYSQEFDACLKEYRAAKSGNLPQQPTPYCAPFVALVEANTAADWDAALELVPYCSDPKATAVVQKRPSIWAPLAVLGLAVGVVAIAVNVTGSRF